MKVKIVKYCQCCTLGTLYQVYDVKYNQNSERFAYKVRDNYGNLVWLFDIYARRLTWKETFKYLIGRLK